MVQRPQQLLRRLAATGYTVLYEDLGDFPRPAVKKLSPTFSLCQGVSALSVPHPHPRILWLSVPFHINLAQQYAPDLIVYDAVDEPKDEFSSWAPYYPAIIQQAHLIFASAKSIYRELSAQHANVHLVPNGVDFPHFSAGTSARPADLPAGQPVIGYSGAIAPWVDWDLLKVITKDNPHLMFVFIGTIFQMNEFPLKGSNVLHLGLKPYGQLPAYVRNFRAGLIPFRLTEMTKGCNPIKLYEYYAAGVPVIATPLPELMSVPKIHLESDPARFSRRLRLLAQNGDFYTNERMSYAQANDWTMRAAEISRKMDQALLLKR